MEDSNINTIDSSKTNNICNIDLKNLFQNMIINNTLTIYNFLPTFFRTGGSPSCIDHIISNVPEKLSNLTTYAPKNTEFNNRMYALKSDHAIFSAVYSCNQIEIPPRFHTFRNQKLLTKDKLLNEINKNVKLQNIFKSNDPNYIANTIICELSKFELTGGGRKTPKLPYSENL